MASMSTNQTYKQIIHHPYFKNKKGELVSKCHYEDEPCILCKKKRKDPLVEYRDIEINEL